MKKKKKKCTSKSIFDIYVSKLKLSCANKEAICKFLTVIIAIFTRYLSKYIIICYIQPTYMRQSKIEIRDPN